MLKRLLMTTYICVTTGALLLIGVWSTHMHYELAAIDHDYEQMIAIREAQVFAGPIVRLAEQIAAENAMFTTIIDRARLQVQSKEAELAAVREALQHAVASLREQAEDLYQVGRELEAVTRVAETRQAVITRLESEVARAAATIKELEEALEAAREREAQLEEDLEAVIELLITDGLLN